MSENKEVTVTKEATAGNMKEAAIEYLRSTGLALPRQYEAQFLNACVLYGLNPFKREIYAVGYGDKWNVIVGYEVYLKRAERTGKLDGWKCEIEGEGAKMKAVLTVWRKDWEHPFTHEAWFTEMQQNSSIWRKMPRLMLKKTAIAQGFRQCFPDEIGGLPYAEEELPPIVDVTPKAAPSTQGEPAATKSASPTPLATANATEAEVVSSDGAPDTASPVDEAPSAISELNELLAQYGKHLQGRPSELIAECRAGKSDPVAMLSRTKSYLRKKGVLQDD